MIQISAGDPIPLFILLDDLSTDRHVVAIIYQRNPVLEIDEIILEADAYNDGTYQNADLVMPNSPVVDVYYFVYDEIGGNLLVTDNETFVLKDESAGSVRIGNHLVANIIMQTNMTGKLVRCSGA